MSYDDSDKELEELTEEEVEEVLQSLVQKGMLEIVGVDESGNNLYAHTVLGKATFEHMDSDPKTRN